MEKRPHVVKPRHLAKCGGRGLLERVIMKLRVPKKSEFRWKIASLRAVGLERVIRAMCYPQPPHSRREYYERQFCGQHVRKGRHLCLTHRMGR